METVSEYQMESQGKLPPGWDCKYDPNTGFYFYINYLTKKTTFEDPRLKYNTNQPSIASINSNDTIPMQPLMHGSPYHHVVYPMNNPPMQAFGGPTPSHHHHHNHHSISASPLLTNRLQQIEMMTPSVTRPSTPRTQLSRMTNVQETSFSAPPLDIEASIQKVNSMFPTVSDAHIRGLFKKYHNREAVIISALQVEKHPITTPGPFATPPMTQRHFQNGTGSVALDYSSILQQSMSRGSPIIGRATSCASGSIYNGSPKIDGYRQSPKPHSPKMKLRYLKSLFPKADETLILDVLCNSDNNVQKASDQLVSCGYEKKDTTIPKMSMRKKDEAKNELKQQRDLQAQQNAVPVPPKPKTPEERNALKEKLQSVYDTIAERIILMALESVDYCEDKAIQILNIVVADNQKEAAVDDEKTDVGEPQNTDAKGVADCTPLSRGTSGHLSTSSSKSTGLKLIVTASTPLLENEFASVGQMEQQQIRRQKPSQKNKLSGDGDTVETAMNAVVKSTSTLALGANRQLAKGTNEDLLLVDYVVWNGANPSLVKGTSKAGPDAAAGWKYVALGANPELCKGPNPGLREGSMYSKRSPSLLRV